MSVVFLQMILTCSLAYQQRNDPEMIDLAGSQRQRTQLIALECLSHYLNTSDQTWHHTIITESQKMLNTSILLAKVDSNVIDPDTGEAIDFKSEINSYLSDVTNFTKTPSNHQLLQEILQARVHLVRDFNLAVNEYAAKSQIGQRRLIIGLLSGMAMLFMLIYSIWLRYLKPFEGHLVAVIDEQSLSDEQLTSAIHNNVNPILTLNLNGDCVGANPAAQKFFVREEHDLLGHGYRAFIDTENTPDHAFLDNVQNCHHHVHFSTTYQRGLGSRTSAKCSIIPADINGKLHSINLLIEDVTSLQLLEDRVRLQSQRAHLLCAIAARCGASDDARIDSTLLLALESMNFQYAYLSRIEDETLLLTNTVGEILTASGTRIPLTESLAARAIESRDLVVIDDLSDPEVVQRLKRLIPDWHTYAFAPIIIHEKVMGVIGFVSHEKVQLLDHDCDFIKMVANLIASSLERAQQQETLDKLAFYDALTGLSNRTKFNRDLEAAISLAVRHDRAFAIHYIDLDFFKAVNDTGGHAIGDLVLKEASRRMIEASRIYDSFTRYGGDEFIAIQAECKSVDQAQAFADRLVVKLCEPYQIEGKVYTLGASIGVAIFPQNALTAKTILAAADAALYQAKANGKCRYELSAEIVEGPEMPNIMTTVTKLTVY